MSKLAKLFLRFAVLSSALSGCGEDSQQNTQYARPVVSSVAISSAQFVKNTCISGLFNTNGSLSITNTCSSAQSLAQANLKFVSQDSSGATIALYKFYNPDSGLNIEFSSAGSNQQIGSFVSVDRSLVIDGGQTLTFSGLHHTIKTGQIEIRM